MTSPARPINYCAAHTYFHVLQVRFSSFPGSLFVHASNCSVQSSFMHVKTNGHVEINILT